MTFNKTAVATQAAPAAIGPYSQGIQCEGLLFVSGQIALDPKSGKLVGTNVADQTRRALKNLTAVLKAAGLERFHVVKTTVYMADLGEFAAMNDVYAEFFPQPSPARAAVEVSKLPRGALVEIDAVAVSGG